MSSPYQHPPSDPHIATLVARLSASLETLPAELERHREALEKGATLGSLRGIPDEEHQALYQVTCRLCDEDQFQHALPLALQLIAHQPHDSRFAFLCGSLPAAYGHDARCRAVLCHLSGARQWACGGSLSAGQMPGSDALGVRRDGSLCKGD